MGLYDVLSSGVEQSDPGLSSAYLSDDLRMSEDARFHAAMTIFGHVEERYPSEPLSFLAKVHHHDTKFDFYGQHYDTVLIGAPIWVASPPPRPMGG
jgi:hypothetical protein